MLGDDLVDEQVERPALNPPSGAQRLFHNRERAVEAAKWLDLLRRLIVCLVPLG